MLLARATLALIALASPNPSVFSFASTSPWPMRGRTAQHDAHAPSAVATTSGVLRWSWHLGYCFSSSPVIGSDGSVYIGASSACYPPSAQRHRRLARSSAAPSPTFQPFPGNGNLCALNGSTGELLWSVLFPTPYMMGGSAAVVAGAGGGGLDMVYAPSGSSDEVFAFRSDGAITHVFPLGQHAFSSPVVSAAGGLYVGVRDNCVWAYNATSGALLWHFQTQDTVDASPALSPDESLVYVGSNDYSVYAFDALSGAVVWTFATGGFVMSSPAVDAATGTVYVGSCDGSLYALNGTTGARLWAFTTGWNVVSSPALGAGSTVVFGSEDHMLRALDRATGALVWAFDCGNAIESSPAIDSAGNVCVT